MNYSDLPTTNGTSAASANDLENAQASAFLAQLDRKRRAAALVIPTADPQVRTRLRELGEPITLFGEGPSERRDRLREFLTSQQEEVDSDGDLVIGDAGDATPEQKEEQEEFYTEGSEALLDARQAIARSSLKRARARIEYQKEEAKIPLRTHVKFRNEIKERLRGFELFGSQVAADRPVSMVRFSPNGEYIAAGHWGGGIKLLSVPNLEEKKHLRGHNDRVGGLTWFPGSTLPESGVSPDAVNLASGGGEGKIQLWSLNADQPLATLSGHTERVCKTEFHPSGNYLASASFDTTWRLWDVATHTELCLQEGHSREVYTVAFNTDGSLLASGGFDSIGRIWDLRTGRTIMILEGHTREIFGMDWSPDGYRVLSGSADGMAICWDVRMVRDIARIPAHSRGVTDLRWYKGNDGPGSNSDNIVPTTNDKGETIPKKSGTFVVSCGFDKNVTITSANDWAPIRTLSGHSANVLACDVSADARWIASCGHDRTVKLFGRDDMSAL